VRSGLRGACVIALLALLAPVLAQAKTERMHGVVLAVSPKTGEAIVRHDAFGAMPSMAMPFRIVPRERARELLPGNAIDATVDTATEPWTLRDITVKSTQALTAPTKRHVVPLRLGDLVPDTPFVDQTGRPFRFSELRGQDAVLSFVYTRCLDPRMCPLISAKFNALQQRIGTRHLHLVEVTLDPSYDRPPVLARYGKMFGANPQHWTLAVGDAEATLDFAARFGIAAFPDADAGIVHTENTVEIGPDGRIRNMIADATWQPADILADVDHARNAAASPLARFDVWRSRAVEVFGNDAGSGGFAGLGLALLVSGALAYLVFRLARRIFAKSA
jgi:protein SCO1